MEQVFCDICGTPFSQNEAVCPICGYAKSENVAILDMPEAEPQGPYTYVKGGRFSPENVNKRNESQQAAVETEPRRIKWGMIVVALVLLLLVVAAVWFLVNHFVPILRSNGDKNGEATAQTQERVACSAVETDMRSLELGSVGDGVLLEVSRVPENTTDPLHFSSSDPSVASVSESGFVTAVGPGSATITIRCGDAQAQCVVECTMVPVVAPTEPVIQEPDPEEVIFTFNRTDFSLREKGELWSLYEGNVDVAKINWFTDNDKVATIYNGVVTAVGPGSTKVYAEYAGVTLSCKVYCNFERDPNEVVEVDEESLQISHVDVTIRVGETFRLYLKDKDGNAAQVQWQAASGGIVSIDGSAIKGLKVGKVTVSVTYGEKTFSCIVRVK